MNNIASIRILYTFIYHIHFYSPPQCITVTISACAAVFPQPYYIPVAGREENETFAIVTEISDQLDPFCSNALITFACYFIHPPCDPDRGTMGLIIIIYGCTLIFMLYGNLYISFIQCLNILSCIA